MESVKAGDFGLVAPLTSEDPRQVAGYLLRARLGAGGMGRVYLAFTRGRRAVAIKVLRAEFGDEEEFRDRFRREVVAAQRVHGMYVAQVLDADPDARPPWLATAYVPGLSLQQAVTDYGPLPADSVFLLIAGIAEALQAIHAAGIVHRDLKPSNVILAADGPRVIDFGIARSVAAPSLTRGGLWIGSPRFMAPEQARGQLATAAADVFALGSLATYAITGRPPFGVGRPLAVLSRVLNEPPDLDGSPADLRPLIERCLAKDPAQRPQPAEIIDTCQARLTDGALAFDGSWLPAAVSAVAAAPLASLVPGWGRGPEDVTGTEPSLSPAGHSAAEHSGPRALEDDTYPSVVPDPLERPTVAAAAAPEPGPVAAAAPEPPPVAVSAADPPQPPTVGAAATASPAAGPAGASPPGEAPGDRQPGTPRETILRRSAVVFGLAAAVAAGVLLLPGMTNLGAGAHRPHAAGTAAAAARASPTATARRRPPASPAAADPSPSGPSTGPRPSAPAAAPPKPASPSASPVPTGQAAFGGTWSGTVSQPGWTVTRWTVALVIPASGKQGSYSAPSLGCSGTLTVKSFAGASMQAVVKTTSAVNPGCVSKARLSLDLSGPAEMSMAWAPVGTGHKYPGAATLTGG